MSELRRKPELDYYKVLQVDPTAEPEVVEASYRALSKKYHPDRNSSPHAPARMSQINSAYDTLRDPTKRRDYDLLRNPTRFVSATPTSRPASSAAPFGSERSTNTNYNAPRPAPSPSPNAANNNNRPNSSSSSAYNAARPATPQGNNAAPNNRSAASGNGASNGANYSSSSAGKAAPKVTRNNHNFYPETSKGSLVRWLALLVVITIAMVGGFFLAKTVLDNPSASNLNPGISQPVQPIEVETVARTTRAASVVTPAPTFTVGGPLSRDQIFNYLNNGELYEGRLTEVTLQVDTLQLQVRLNRGGRIVNGLDNPPFIPGNDELDLLRQAELTAYTLTYSLYGRFPDLKTIYLKLSDPADEKKIIYRVTIPRNLAYTFSVWRGTMDAKTVKQEDFIRAGREDRLLMHLGSPLEDSVRSRINQPDKNNLKAELASWGFSFGTFDVSLDSNGAIVGYFAVRPEEEKLADYARIFYILYTRFPNLDRIQVQDTLPGTPPKFSRASSRTLFNRATTVDWAQATFDNRAKELLDTLPSTITTLPPTSGNEAQVNPGVNTLVKSWQIVNPGTTNRLSQISALPSTRGQYVLVKVPLKNLSGILQWPLPNAYFSLMDAQGRTYQPDPVASISYILDVERKIPPGPVENNRDIEMKLIFDIPLNASGLRLIFQDRDARASLPITPQQ